MSFETAPNTTTFLMIAGGRTKDDYVIKKGEVEKLGLTEKQRNFMSNWLHEQGSRQCIQCGARSSGYHLHKMEEDVENNVVFKDRELLLGFVYCSSHEEKVKENALPLFNALLQSGKLAGEN